LRKGFLSVEELNPVTGLNLSQVLAIQTGIYTARKLKNYKTNSILLEKLQENLSTMNSSNDVKNLFLAFTNGNYDMDGRQFAKMAKDCQLLDKKLTATDIDLIFAKVKDRSVRKIIFYQFELAIDQIAQKKKVPKDDILKLLAKSNGPTFSGTKAAYNKFHDDKSLYTGVYANGGPSNVDVGGTGSISNIAQLCDRTASDVRGRKVY